MTGALSDQQLDEIAAHVPNCRYGCDACEAFPALAEEIRWLRLLLADVAGYLAAIHRHASRHDVLAANLGCAGCELLGRIEGGAAP